MLIRRSMKKNKKISDFGAGSQLETLMLREKTWRIEMSRSKAVRFFRGHKMGIIAVLALIFAGIAARYALVGFASTVDFYPSLCMGSWQNVQNVLGKPDLPLDAPSSSFTALNSAIFVTSTDQVFCGNFLGADPGEKIFEKATLKLSWSFIFPSDTSSSVPTSTNFGTSSGGGGITVIASSSAATSSDDDFATSSISASSSTTPSSSTADLSSATPSSTDASSSAPTDVSTSTDASSAPSVSTPATTTPDVSTADQPTVPSSTPTPAPAQDTTSTAIRNILRYLISPALAAPAWAEIPTTVVPTTTSVAATTTMVGTPSTSSAPLNIILMPSSSVPVASSGTQEILQVNFSLDGKTWTTLGTVDAGNWQDASFDLPITSWSDLQNLQIGILGFSGNGGLVQSIYLDGMDVSVEYNDADSLQSSFDQSAASPDQPAQVSLPPQAPPLATFDPRAKQSCSIQPYVETIQRGDSVSFGVSLHPSEKPPPPFDLQMGELPAGITGSVAYSTKDPLHPSISLAAAPSAAQGSFNVVVLYEEKNASGTFLPNYCQFNLVVQ